MMSVLGVEGIPLGSKPSKYSGEFVLGRFICHLAAGKTEAREAGPDREIHAEGRRPDGINDSHDNVLIGLFRAKPL